MIDQLKHLITNEKYSFRVRKWKTEANLLAIPDNGKFSPILLEANTTAGKQTIQCLTDWWDENGTN